jgi:hypothetical protein
MSLHSKEWEVPFGDFVVDNEGIISIDKSKLARTEIGVGLSRYSISTTPSQYPASIKVKVEPIRNVYSTLAQNAVPQTYQSPYVEGATVYAEMAFTGIETDNDVVDSEPVVQPCVVSLKCRIPKNSIVTDTDIWSAINILALALSKSTATTENVSPEISKLARGVTEITQF